MPIVHPLPATFSMEAAFRNLAHLPGVLWFDSAADGPSIPTSTVPLAPSPLAPSPLAPSPPATATEPLGRYSFLAADPVATITANVGDLNPWPELIAWASRLPATAVEGLPPFQGGMAGVWGYEAATWLEAVGPLPSDDLPTAAIRVGAYDWVIAHDRVANRSWLISHGFHAPDWIADPQHAAHRRDQVLGWLADEAPPSLPAPAPPPAVPQPLFPTSRTGVFSNFSSVQLRRAIDDIIRRIRHGDSFQVNLAQRLVHPLIGTPSELYLRLRQTNPAPLAGYFDGGDFQVLSSSPEGFLRIRDGWVETRPIKGTASRTGDPEIDRAAAAVLSASDKERAENVMIVDLMRNDLSRVCEDDSVTVTQLCEVEAYAFVQHLVSVVRGKLRPGVSAIDALAACFPGGSVTGAPKIEAMRTIAQLEPNRRGPYCGSLGYVSVGGAAEFNILIRTVTVTRGWCQIPVGGGITARSDSRAEERETWVKAEGMLRATREGIMAE